MSSGAEDRIHEILEEWLDRRRAGAAAGSEEVLRAHPELAEKLRPQLEALQVLDQFLETPAPSTPALDPLGDLKVSHDWPQGPAGMVSVHALDPEAIASLEQAVEEGLRRNRKVSEALAVLSETPFATRRTADRRRSMCNTACAEAKEMRDTLATLHATLTVCRDRLSGSRNLDARVDSDATFPESDTTWTDLSFASAGEHVLDLNLSRGDDLSDSLTGFVDQITELLAQRPSDRNARRLIATAKDLAENVLVAAEWWERGARELLEVLADAKPSRAGTTEPPATVRTPAPGEAARREGPASPLAELEQGTLHSFAAWPNEEVPRDATGVYTVWSDEELVYVGSGEKPTSRGLFARLDSHATGRRSSDPFHVAVCDRLVLPSLDAMAIHDVGEGRASLDDLVRGYVRKHLGYRFLVVGDGREALAIQTQVRRGALAAGKPLLNPDG